MTTAPRVPGLLRPAARLLTGSTCAVLGYGVLQDPGPGVEEGTEHDPAARKQQEVQFYKNMAMIGGLLFAELA
jgi:hypothetical protein